MQTGVVLSVEPVKICAMKVVIACGGTGGHLFPGIAVAEELQKQGHEPVLVISEKKVDAEASAKYGNLRFEVMPAIAKPAHALAQDDPVFAGTGEVHRAVQDLAQEGECRGGVRDGRIHFLCSRLCRQKVGAADLRSRFQCGPGQDQYHDRQVLHEGALGL